jgi:hypothetical protein
MADIRIDLDRLERAHSNLAKVVTEFTSTDQLGTAAADAVGHPVLEIAVDQFVSGWAIRRSELAEELQYLSDATQAIHDTFVELDTELATRAEAIAIAESTP